MQNRICLTKAKFILLLLFNALIIIFFLISWIMLMVRREGASFLTSVGLNNLKYYTVLSNIMEVVVSAILGVQLIRVYTGRSDSIPHLLFFLKYMATTAVSVTFLVVVTMLWPLTHYPDLFTGSNFWLHVVIPLLAMIEFLFLDKFGMIRFPETLLVVIPAVLYACGYSLNLIINGVGSGTTTNDFYGFLHWGLGIGIILCAIIFLINWGAALLLRLVNKKIHLFDHPTRL